MLLFPIAERVYLLALALTVGACRPAPPAAPPEQAVQRFFAAVTADDCPTALSQLASGMRARVAPDGRCEELFGGVRRYPLERVVETKVDGRNSDAQLVRARLRGRTTDAIIRVQAEGRSWKIFAL